MKIKTSKENLLLGIQIVQNIVSAKATLPILSNILIETKVRNSAGKNSLIKFTSYISKISTHPLYIFIIPLLRYLPKYI